MPWPGPTRTPLVAAIALGLGGLLAGVPPASAQQSHAPGPHSVITRSPNGRLGLTVAIRTTGSGTSAAVYSVNWRGAPLVTESALGLDLVDSGPLGTDVGIASVRRSAHDGTVQGLIGKASSARDHYRETVVALVERTAPHRRIELVVRAYDDGVAFRYRIPAQRTVTAITIAAERTHVVVDEASVAYVLKRGGYVSSYEGFYTVAPLRDLPADTLLALPVLLHHPGGAWLAVSEAALTNYAGMYLARTAAPGDLVSRLSPLPGLPNVAVRGRAPLETPWRVFLVGDDPAQLIASNVITLLNPPSAIADVSWIHPGKTTFPWWNDYVVPDTNFTPGLNTATAKYYIDFCAAHGIPYHTLDGYQDLAWYGGHIEPRDSIPIPDITRGTDTLDLPEVLRYAKEKNVRLRVWMHWKALRPQLDTALARYERMGIEGIMVDFMDRDDQEMIAFYHEIVSKAAAHHLTVVFHGTSKPTGISRTYPNLLTVEAVMGLEYDKFDGQGVTASHELLVPFTRMLAGPLDFHQGGFHYFTPSAFHTQYTGPRIIGTRARTLAMYVVYEDPLPMMADAPSSYEGQPGLDFLAAIPTTWDETRALGGIIGEHLTIARRRGTTWYVGTMTDEQARTVTIPLRFLGAGTFVAEIWADDVSAVPNAKTVRVRVTAADVVQARLAPAGGHVMRIVPARRGDASLPRYSAPW